MKSFRKFALVGLMALLPFTAFSQASLPSAVEQAAAAVTADPSDQEARNNLVAALEAAIQEGGLDSVGDLAESLLSTAEDAAEAEALAEAIAAASRSVAVAQGADLAPVRAAVNAGVRRGTSNLGAAASSGAVAAVNATLGGDEGESGAGDEPILPTVVELPGDTLSGEATID